MTVTQSVLWLIKPLHNLKHDAVVGDETLKTLWEMFFHEEHLAGQHRTKLPRSD